jgi:curli biogenesis system outer membrane secretion channel CsgG
MRIRGVAAVLALCTISTLAQGPAKKRVAVFDFENAAVQGSITSPFFQTSTPNLGKAVADLLVTRLVQNGVLVVVERNALDKLLAEQNLTNSDRTDPQTAAKLGRLLGVDAIVMGAITHYDYEDKTTGGGPNRFSPIGGGAMTTKHDIKAKVQISARIVSVDTAEVVAVADGVGETVRKGVKRDIRDNNGYAAIMGGNANNPILNETLDLAIFQLGTHVDQTAPKIPTHIPVIEGLVADANDAGRLVLNVGSRGGVKVGDRLQVWRMGKEIRDPATGKVLLRDDTLLGEAVVNSVDEAFSIAAYTGTEPVKTGDLVKGATK